MKAQSRQDGQKAEELPKDMIELAAEIALLPPQFRTKIEPIYSRVIESTKRPPSNSKSCTRSPRPIYDWT